MKKKCIFVAAMFACIIAFCYVSIMLYTRWNSSDNTDENFTVVTSFYPMYIAALNIVDGASGVNLENLSEPQTGCLHDFQLTPEDMKLLSTADMFIINGGGIESFMSDVASAYPTLDIVEACENVELLASDEGEHENESEDLHESEHADGYETERETETGDTVDVSENSDADNEHEHIHGDSDSEHEHTHGDSDENAHAWMSISRYRVMVQTILDALKEADPDNAALYEENATSYDEKLAALDVQQEELKEKITGQNIIIFHEAYEYVADDLGLNVSFLMDLDEERSVSAGEVKEVLDAIETDDVSVILAEELYGSDMGDTVMAESDVSVIYIDPLTRGDYDKDSYINGMKRNIKLIEAAF